MHRRKVVGRVMAVNHVVVWGGWFSNSKRQSSRPSIASRRNATA
ncbi:hypothetical protein RISK_003079 [Rhodopirellula islandica]|uniref:Uncharacterized protein n=1 Tax=Rhodopirellula islandica TaxID=595434 RepID=A0A0J1BE54_RHOIS|nr:hypothetical protein RISK_003079 [Rhodopirellula islandica]